jgi:ATP-dependent RNA/DNA helicase IGHMBP2
VMLREQYRMHEKIMDFSSKYFYKDRLIANENVRQWKVFGDDQPVEFIDTAGTGFFEQMEQETRSSFNKEEANLLFQHFDAYIQMIQLHGELEGVTNIGIISPYKAQVSLLQDLFDERLAASPELKQKVAINTVDSFQGQERDIIYISMVRSNEKGEIGFLADTRRMNVAMTRAKKKLVIIGDSATIGHHPFYEKLLDYINEISAYRSAFEMM